MELSRPKVLVIRAGVEPQPVLERLVLCGVDGLAVTVMRAQAVPEGRARLGEIFAAEADKPVLATSRQGIIHLSLATEARTMRVAAVGEATAAEAARRGFVRVEDAGEDAQVPETMRGRAHGLAEYIARQGGNDRAWVYPSAEEVRQDMAALLAGQGRQVERVVAYRMAPVEEMPREAARAWEEYAGALFYSRNAARHFTALAEAAGLKREGMAAFCLSAEIAEAVRGAGFAEVIVAEEPKSAALVAAVGEWATGCAGMRK